MILPEGRDTYIVLVRNPYLLESIIKWITAVNV